MRLLSSDDKHAQRAVREMEKRGYDLTQVETSGAHDGTARELFELMAHEKSAKRWRAFWRVIGFILTLCAVYFVT